MNITKYLTSHLPKGRFAFSTGSKDEDKKLLEFLFNVINPNEMEQYMAMYHSQNIKSDED